jgi:hypothetical protein
LPWRRNCSARRAEGRRGRAAARPEVAPFLSQRTTGTVSAGAGRWDPLSGPSRGHFGAISGPLKDSEAQTGRPIARSNRRFPTQGQRVRGLACQKGGRCSLWGKNRKIERRTHEKPLGMALALGMAVKAERVRQQVDPSECVQTLVRHSRVVRPNRNRRDLPARQDAGAPRGITKTPSNRRFHSLGTRQHAQLGTTPSIARSPWLSLQGPAAARMGCGRPAMSAGVAGPPADSSLVARLDCGR